jgi:hypothetical protein
MSGSIAISSWPHSLRPLRGTGRPKAANRCYLFWPLPTTPQSLPPPRIVKKQPGDAQAFLPVDVEKVGVRMGEFAVQAVEFGLFRLAQLQLVELSFFRHYHSRVHARIVFVTYFSVIIVSPQPKFS